VEEEIRIITNQAQPTKQLTFSTSILNIGKSRTSPYQPGLGVSHGYKIQSFEPLPIRTIYSKHSKFRPNLHTYGIAAKTWLESEI